jgi:hypothetical protein
MEMAKNRILIKDAGVVDYDGSQILPLWAYRELGVQGDSVVIFQGEMKVPREALIDVEDQKESEAAFPISSDMARHFIVEHFDDPSLRLAYHRQSILVNAAKEKIIDLSGKHVKRKGSDLFFDEKKLSVSVATASVSSSKIHLGLNITSKGVPHDVNALGLEELGIKNFQRLAEDIAESYVNEIEGIELDIAKTRVF